MQWECFGIEYQNRQEVTSVTICRKCGKEIPDGEDLCGECKSKEMSSGESYLDEL